MSELYELFDLGKLKEQQEKAIKYVKKYLAENPKMAEQDLPKEVCDEIKNILS